jgi:tetratricopeptide (TPR) repeat protein
MELGEIDEAPEAFERALQIDPEYSDAHFNLADAMEQVGRFSEARRHWKKLVRLEPVGEWAGYARARLAPARSG